MATKHTRRFRVAHRRQQVAELYLQGRTQSDIAQQLDIAQSTVSDDLEWVRRRWHDAALRDFDQIRAREVEKLDLIEKEAWAAWGRSQKPAQSAVVTEEGTGTGQRSRKSLKNQCGDPRFLAQVNACIIQRRALLGLDVMPAVAAAEGQFDGNISLQDRRERILTLLAAFGHRERIGLPGAGTDSSQPGDVCLGNERQPLENGPPPAAA